MNNPNEIIIRPAMEKDVEDLFAMLVDLVKHEGIYDRFQMTNARLRDELFAPKADWHCLVALSNKKLIGFCFYSFANLNRAFNTTPLIQIDDLYVCAEFRRLAVGSKLLRELALIAKDKNISRFNVLCVKDNVHGQNFYKKIGGEKLEFIDMYKIQVESLLS